MAEAAFWGAVAASALVVGAELAFAVRLTVSAVSAGLGFVVVDNSSVLSGVLIESFAAGALLTMIADEMAPEAYDRSAVYAGLATVAGFALAVLLTTLE